MRDTQHNGFLHWSKDNSEHLELRLQVIQSANSSGEFQMKRKGTYPATLVFEVVRIPGADEASRVHVVVHVPLQTEEKSGQSTGRDGFFLGGGGRKREIAKKKGVWWPSSRRIQKQICTQIL